MKISFLITYYNQEAYVRESMDSVLAIEKPDEWEILVGDDGSSDGTAAAVREYIARDPEHIRLIVQPREEGVKYSPVRRAGANRLSLLEACTGDCFCSLDGDDFYTDTAFVKEAVGVFEKHPEVTVVSFGYRYYTDGTFGEPMTLPEGMAGPVDTDAYLRGQYIHSGACVHRVAWGKERIAALRAIGSYDDNDIVMNGLRYGRMYHIRRAVYAYRQTGDSVYNSMDSLEKAMLNVQGLDLGMAILGDEKADALLARYAAPLVQAYASRRRIRRELGDRADRRLADCEGLERSVCRDLICWDALSGAEKAAVRNLAARAARLQPVRAAKTLLRQLPGLRRERSAGQ